MYAFVELLGFHRIGVLDVFEHFGRERWEALEVYFLASGESVADLEVAGVGYADDVAREGFVHYVFLLCHESRRGGETHHLPLAYVLVVDIALELA